jgi:hypothetical protein
MVHLIIVNANYLPSCEASIPTGREFPWVSCGQKSPSLLLCPEKHKLDKLSKGGFTGFIAAIKDLKPRGKRAQGQPSPHSKPLDVEHPEFHEVAPLLANC